MVEMKNTCQDKKLTHIKTDGIVSQDTKNAARDVAKKTAGCVNPASDKDGQDRLVSVVDLAVSGAKMGYYRLTGDKGGYKRAKAELKSDASHYGFSDLAVDVGTTVIGGGVGKILLSGAMGAAGRLGAKKVAGAALSSASKGVGEIVEAAGEATLKSGRIIEKAGDKLVQSGKGGKIAEGIKSVGEGIKGSKDVFDGAKKVVDKTAKKGEGIANEAEYKQQVLIKGSEKGKAVADKQASHLEKQARQKKFESNNENLSTSEREHLRKAALKDGLEAKQIKGRASKASELRQEVIDGHPHTKKTFAAGVVGVVGARQVVSGKSQEGSKKSSDVRIEMSEIAEALTKQNIPVTANNLIDVHKKLKQMNLKGHKEVGGLSDAEESKLTRVINSMDFN